MPVHVHIHFLPLYSKSITVPALVNHAVLTGALFFKVWLLM